MITNETRKEKYFCLNLRVGLRSMFGVGNIQYNMAYTFFKAKS